MPVAGRTVLAVIVVVGVVACGSGSPSPERVAKLRVVTTTVFSARMRDIAVASPALGRTMRVRLLLPVH
jgi:hypothetical protein